MMHCSATWKSGRSRQASARLPRFRQPCYDCRDPPGDLVKLIQNYIDGRFVSGKQEFADVNPADGTVIAQVTEADEAQVDEAVHAARRALRGEWGRLGVRERAARLAPGRGCD